MSRLGDFVRSMTLLGLVYSTAWSAELKSNPTGCLACGYADRVRAAAESSQPGQLVAAGQPADQIAHPVSSRRAMSTTDFEFDLMATGCDESCAPASTCHGLACRFCHRCPRPHIVEETGWFNCGCSGSYKFPVPPQYTYHWPGIYSQQLMTEYASPWRFPPLKPYTDEMAPHGLGQGPAAVHTTATYEPVATLQGSPAPPRRVERVGSTSDKIKQHYRIR